MAVNNDELPDLRQLNTFVAIVERGGFSAAARQLTISQPSVSQQIKRLEAWVGSPIFERAGATSKLTRDGEALIIFARAMVGMSGQAYAHFKGGEQRGSVRLGLNETFAITAVPKVLSFFSQLHTNFELVIETSFDSSKLFDDLDEGRLDLVVTKTAVAQTRGDVLEIVPLVWVGREADMRLPEGPVPIVAVTGAKLASELVLAALTQAGRAWTVRFRSQNLAALDAAVSSGLGVAAAMRGLRTGSAVALNAGCGLPEIGEVALCLDVAKEAASPAVASFATFFKKVIVELDLGGRRAAHAGESPSEAGSS